MTDLREGGRLCFYGGHRARNQFHHVFDLNHRDRFSRRVFECAIIAHGGVRLLLICVNTSGIRGAWPCPMRRSSIAMHVLML